MITWFTFTNVCIFVEAYLLTTVNGPYWIIPAVFSLIFMCFAMDKYEKLNDELNKYKYKDCNHCVLNHGNKK